MMENHANRGNCIRADEAFMRANVRRTSSIWTKMRDNMEEVVRAV